MTVKLGYAIHFVADMDRAVSFYRDTLGLTLESRSRERRRRNMASSSANSSTPKARDAA
jgi:catechol 2,3-dioxygenase-like lactoylglutathione lyase family enzyme